MAGLLQFEGSVIPEGIRKAAQAALDNRSDMMNEGRANARPAPASWETGQKNISLKDAGQGLKGILGTGAKALGGAGAAYELATGANDYWGKGRWDNIQNILEKRDVRQAVEADPGLPGRGVDTVNRITDSAMKGVRGLMEQAREPQTSLPLAPEQQEKAAEATQEPQVEAARQRIQQGTLKGLQTGEVHVSQLAEGVVQADAQRAGTELKPEEQKVAVAAEITAMKTMDKSQLSEYVSYALVAGGLLASVFDKSGQAGNMFHESLNKQLDRSLAAGKMAFDQKMALSKDAREDRKVDLTETDVKSKVKNRDVTAEQGEKRLGIMDADSKTKKFSAESQAAIGKSRLGIMAEGNRLKAEGLEIQRGEAASKQALRQSKIDNPSGGGDKGVPLSFKDNSQVVKDVYESQGLKVDPKLQSQIAGRLPTLQKKYPQLSQAELVELAAGEYDTETDNGWFSDTVRVRKPKGE